MHIGMLLLHPVAADHIASAVQKIVGSIPREHMY